MTQSTSFIKSKLARNLFFLIGILLLVFFIYRANPLKILSYLPILGFNFFFILLITLTGYFIYSFAWKITLRDFTKEAAKKLSIYKIFLFKIAGEAINNLTPLSWGGGDPMRVILLKDKLNTQQAAASVTVDRILNNFAAALSILTGILITLIHFSLSTEIRIGLLILLGLLILGTSYLYLRSHKGIFSLMVSILKKLRIKRHFHAKNLEKVTEIDRYIAFFYKEDRIGFLTAFFLHLTGRLLAVLEIYLIAFFLHSPLKFFEAFLLYSIGIVINLIFFFIPGRLGVLDGTYQGVFFLMNQDPSMGLGIQLVRRLRTLFWTLLGFLFLSLNKKSQAKSG